MRPDARSFSFTWLKGQQRPIEETTQHSATTSVSSLSNAKSGSKENNGTDKGRKLKRLGSSFLKSFENYSTMENEIQEEKEMEDDHQNLSGSSGSGSSGSTGSTGMSIGKRLNKTVQDVKTSLGNLSQRLRRSTRRRYRMGQGSPNEISPTRRILGRTPTKLYSPFGIETPLGKSTKRLERPSTPRLQLQRRTRTVGYPYSPSNNFNRDVSDAMKSVEDFHIVSRDITRRSVRF